MTFCTEERLRIITLDDDGDAYDYRDGQPFADYCAVVASVLSAEKMTIRQIHLALGTRAIPRWTIDALDRVADPHRAYIDRFTLKGDPRK